MNKIMEYIKDNKKVHYIIILIVTCIIAIPICSLQLIDTHDGKGHISRIFATQLAIFEGNFPYLLTPNTVDNVLGYAINLFYGKLPVYGALILKLLPITYTNALKAFAIITIFLSGVTMYNCVLQMTKKKMIAVISAILYMTANYRFEEIYTRFALGEFVTFIFMPIILQGIHNIIYEDGKKAWILGIGTTLLLISHSITTMYFGIFCFGYILLQGKVIWKKRIWKQIAIQMLFAVILTAFYTIPIIEHKQASNYLVFEPSIMGTNIDMVMEYAVELKKLFTTEGSKANIDIRLGISICVCLTSSIFVIKKLPKKIKEIWIIGLCLGLIALFMCTKYFPWVLMPDIFYNIQFAWRLAGIAVFFISISSAIGISYVIENCSKQWIQNVIYITCITMVLISSTIYAKSYQWDNSYADMKYEQKLLNNHLDTDIYRNWDYLPVKAFNKYSLNRDNKVHILEGTSKITKEEKNGLEMKITIEDGSKNDKIELPYLFYLGYDIKLETNEKSWKLETVESKNGFVEISLPEDIEEGEVWIKYKGTIIEEIGYGISIIGGVLFIIDILKTRKR